MLRLITLVVILVPVVATAQTAEPASQPSQEAPELTPIPACAEVAEFTPCGGEVVGTWAYDTIECIDLPDMSAAFDGCQGVEAVVSANVDGSVTFNADGTWSRQEERTMEMVITLPVSCMPPQATSCEMLGNPELTATTVGESCRLHRTGTELKDETGTYTMDGHAATLLNDADPTDIDVGELCVQGGSMRVRVTDPTSGIVGIITHTRTE